MATERLHWAFNVLTKLQNMFGDKKRYTMAAGITPSGTIHIGNFREVITVDLVARALQMSGKEVRFIYSWDDFDVFRKVPKNMPDQELLTTHLRMAITDTPDTTGTYPSFAERNKAEFAKHLPTVGVFPEFISQSEMYRKCAYAKEIDFCLAKTKEIKQILDKYRKEPLPDDWLPVSIFCDACKKDTIENITYHGSNQVSYTCSCGHKETFDIRKKGIIKLGWRVDWPMRWHYEKLDFEPAGKDHFASGGARQSGVEIHRALWHETPPFGFMYEWIGIKGGGQFSSSSGNVVTLNEVLEIYEPAMVRWLFASTRPNAEFSISFDTDVLKIHEDFDRCERIYYGKEQVNEKETQKQKEIYELSAVSEIPEHMPYQPPFRHLTTVLQINEMDIEKTIAFFREDLKGPNDEARLRMRAMNAANWIQKYAEPDFRFTVNEKIEHSIIKDEDIKAAIKMIPPLLFSKTWNDPKELHEAFYALIQERGIDPKRFFTACYQVLIGKDKGPKLASFIIEIGIKRAGNLFAQI